MNLLKKLFTRKPRSPFNFLNNVMMPLPSDPRWEYSIGGDCDLKVARIHIEHIYDNEHGADYFTLYVDGIAWKGAADYCAAVFSQVRKDFLARRIRDGAEIVRNNVSQVGRPE